MHINKYSICSSLLTKSHTLVVITKHIIARNRVDQCSLVTITVDQLLLDQGLQVSKSK